MEKQLLKINFGSFAVDTSKMTLEDYDKLLDKELDQFKYDVDLTNVARAKADKAFLNKLVKNLEDQRKEYFKPYEDLKKELIKREKTVKTLSDKLRDDAKALEENIVDDASLIVKQKEVETFTIRYAFTGTSKFYDELDKLCQKHNATKEIIKPERKVEEFEQWEL